MSGGWGLIGREILKILPKNYKAVVLSRNPLKNHLGLECSNLNFTHFETDYTVDSLRKILKGTDGIIHLAAQRLPKTNTNSSFKNVLIDYNLFQACESLNIANIVFASSCGVYGRNPDTPWLEEYEPSPENPYSLGKVVSEETANYFNKKGLFIKCLRLAHVLSINARKKYMLGKFLENALNGESIKLYASDYQQREYIYVKDIARGILASLHMPEIKGIFNFGSGEVVSIPQLAELINDTFYNRGRVIKCEVDSPAKEISLMNSELFYSTFNFKPKWSIREALIDMHKTNSLKLNRSIQ